MVAAFVILAAVTLAASVMVVLSRHVIHSALYLVVSFLAVAGIFIVLGAEFLAAVQIIIYAGSIVVLFVFVTMTVGYTRLEDQPIRRGRMAFVAALGLVVLLELVYALLTIPEGGGGSSALWEAGSGTAVQIGQLIFSEWLLPFELLSLVILTAMIGIAVLRKEGRRR